MKYQINSWKDGIEASKKLYERETRIYSAIVESTMRRAAIAHPETGGIPMLVYNWGNDESRAIWEKGNLRASAVLRTGNKIYHKIIDRMREVA